MAGMKGNGLLVYSALNYGSLYFALCVFVIVFIFFFFFHVAVMEIINHLAIALLAFAGSIGMTLVILACALPRFNVWWPFFVVFLYLLTPIPTMVAKRYTERTGTPNSSMDFAIFITMMFVVSSFALPTVLARAPVSNPVIQWGACWLTLAANVVVYVTYIVFFMTLYQDDSDYTF